MWAAGRYEDRRASLRIIFAMWKAELKTFLKHVPGFIVRPVDVHVGGAGVRPLVNNQRTTACCHRGPCSGGPSRCQREI
jgi:hypothetical protein